MRNSNEPARTGAPVNEDEMEIVSAFLLLLRRRRWVIGVTAACALLGIVHALIAPKAYYAHAIIAPKEADKGGDASRLISQFGGISGMVAAQFGRGNAGLDKMDVLLKSHDLAEAVIVEHGLLPALFPRSWDARAKSWRGNDSSKIPSVRSGGAKIVKRFLTVTTDPKKNLITVGMTVPDSVLARDLVDHYLKALNERIRSDAMRDADQNRQFLEKQLSVTTDPTLLEKLQLMIAYEIEKYLLVNSRAFEVLVKARLPFGKAKPKRARIVILWIMAGFVLSVAGVFAFRGIEVLWKAARETGQHG